MEYMTTKEVADYLRVQPKTIKRMIDRGAIPCYKIGRQYRFVREEVDTVLTPMGPGVEVSS